MVGNLWRENHCPDSVACPTLASGQILEALVKGWGPELGVSLQVPWDRSTTLTGKPSKQLDIALQRAQNCQNGRVDQLDLPPGKPRHELAPRPEDSSGSSCSNKALGKAWERRLGITHKQRGCSYLNLAPTSQLVQRFQPQIPELQKPLPHILIPHRPPPQLPQELPVDAASPCTDLPSRIRERFYFSYFWAILDLHCCVGFLSSCGEWGLFSEFAVHGALSLL